MSKDGPELKHSCQVLISLWDDGPGTSAELSERTGLTPPQATSALNFLCRKQKAKRAGSAPGQGLAYIYEAREDQVKNERPRTVRSKSNAAREIERARGKRSLQGEEMLGAVRFRDRKIALLRRLLDSAGCSDKDLLIGVLNDYLRLDGLPPQHVS